MNPRMNYKDVEPRVYEAMIEAEKLSRSFRLDTQLIHLIKFRISQINGCGFCLNMHSAVAMKLGVSDQKLHTLAAWWETPFFTEEEQAALKLAEEVTLITRNGVSDAVFNKAVEMFGVQKVAQLIYVINNINNWNRIAITSHLVPELNEQMTV